MVFNQGLTVIHVCEPYARHPLGHKIICMFQISSLVPFPTIYPKKKKKKHKSLYFTKLRILDIDDPKISPKLTFWGIDINVFMGDF